MEKLKKNQEGQENKAQYANKVQHVDRRMNALPHKPTNQLNNQPTNQPMDAASYRGALSPLKRNSVFNCIHSWNANKLQSFAF